MSLSHLNSGETQSVSLSFTCLSVCPSDTRRVQVTCNIFWTPSFILSFRDLLCSRADVFHEVPSVLLTTCSFQVNKGRSSQCHTTCQSLTPQFFFGLHSANSSVCSFIRNQQGSGHGTFFGTPSFALFVLSEQCCFMKPHIGPCSHK